MKTGKTILRIVGGLTLLFMFSLNSCSILGCVKCKCPDGGEYLACAEKDINFYESTGCECD